METDRTTVTDSTNIIDWGSPGGVYVNVDPQARATTIDQATTNVVLISFAHLNDEPKVVTGEPVCCSRCGAHVSILSTIIEQNCWNCEFCGSSNKVDEDLQKDENFFCDYLIEKGSSNSEREMGELIMFVIDISGSMSQTTFVPDAITTNAASITAEPPGRYLSRLEFLQGAVTSQLDMLASIHPKTKVGLITFGSAVSIYQDKDILTISDDSLNDYSTLLERSDAFSVTQPISATLDYLKKTINELKEGGTTALGPALLIATSICSKNQGSKCIVCTDGLANVGVGSLEKSDGGDYYREVGAFAKRKGVVISVISIKGSNTKLEKLGSLADITKGEVDLVDPVNLNFNNLLSTEIFATNVTLDLYISRQFTFLREIDFTRAPTHTKISRDIGNAVASSQTTFEFTYVPVESTDTVVPSQFMIQVHITYTKRNGDRYKRVCSMSKAVTHHWHEAVQNLDIQTISAHLAKTSAIMARQGNYEGALDNAVQVKALIEGCIKTEEDKQLWEIFMGEFKDISEALKSAMKKEAEVGVVFGDTDAQQARSDLRSDYTAKKLYNYSSAQKRGCVVQ